MTISPLLGAISGDVYDSWKLKIHTDVTITIKA